VPLARKFDHPCTGDSLGEETALLDRHPWISALVYDRRRHAENIARLEERYGATLTEPVFICECANDGCSEQLAIDLETYERVRKQPRLFFVLPGHQHPEFERVLETHHDYLVVEKTGEAGQVAERTYP
jgi:hypothetical protein